MPYAILAGALPATRMGVYMGIFNFFIVLPEIIARPYIRPAGEKFPRGNLVHAVMARRVHDHRRRARPICGRKTRRPCVFPYRGDARPCRTREKFMTLTFRLRFHTRVGQSLFITGNHELLGGGAIENAVPLRYLDKESWQATIEFAGRRIPGRLIIYNYILRNADGSTVDDWAMIASSICRRSNRMTF